MPGYEYKVVPAPTKGQKAKGVKTPEGRFAQGLQQVLNVEGGAGWEYLRAELLPSEERSGLTGSTTNWRNVLVFRRMTSEIGSAVKTRPPEISVEEPETEEPQVQTHQPDPTPEETRTAENLATVSGMFTAQKSRGGDGGSEDGASDEGPVERS